MKTDIEEEKKKYLLPTTPTLTHTHSRTHALTHARTHARTHTHTHEKYTKKSNEILWVAVVSQPAQAHSEMYKITDKAA